MGKAVQLTLGCSQLEWEEANCGIFLYWHGRLIEVSNGHPFLPPSLFRTGDVCYFFFLLTVVHNFILLFYCCHIHSLTPFRNTGFCSSSIHFPIKYDNACHLLCLYTFTDLLFLLWESRFYACLIDQCGNDAGPSMYFSFHCLGFNS